MTQSTSAPPPLDPDVNGLWKEAIEEFQEKAQVDKFGNADSESWATIFQQNYHKNDRLDKICKAVGNHMSEIDNCIAGICSVCELTASVCGAASPAAVLVQGFAKTFSILANIQKTHDDIIGFFKDMKDIFANVSMVANGLDKEGKLAVLRGYVMVIFSCALKILAVAISSTKSRMKKALKDLWKGGGELDGLKAEMKAARDNLDKGIGYATYSRLYSLQEQANRNDRNEILDWLCTWDFETRHKDLLKEAEHGKDTGSWLLNSEPFQDWRGKKSSRIWYTGKPGAGKSVLASIVIQELDRSIPKRTSYGPTLAFMHLTYRSNPKPRVEDLLGAMLRQIVTRISARTIPTEVREAFDEIAHNGKLRGKYPSSHRGKLAYLLSQLVKERTLYIILDAMDECPFNVRKPLMDILRGICPDVRIMVTARVLERRDELADGFAMEKLIAHDSDIDEYIAFVISQNLVLKKGNHEDIKTNVKAKGQRVFLLIKLHMIALSELEDPDRIVPALLGLPENLDESYSSAIERIKEKPTERRTQAMNVLSWMSYIFRDLHVDEMCAALAYQTGLSFNERMITSVCCGLVIVETDGVVRFVHYSAQVFFRARREKTLPTATTLDSFHLEIARCCAEYLCDNAPRDLSSEDILECITNFPFSQYAAEFLHQHLDSVPSTVKFDEVRTCLSSLVDDTSKRSFYYRLLERLDCYPTKSRHLDAYSPLRSTGKSSITPLHLAVFMGYSNLVNHYIEIGSDLNALDDYEQSPLIVAFKRDLRGIVETLLEKGALFDLSTRSGHVLLSYATAHDFDHATGLILRRLPIQTVAEQSLADLGVLIVLPLIVFQLIVRIISEIWISSPEPSEIITKPPGTKPVPQGDILKHYGRLLLFAYEGKADKVEDFLKASDRREITGGGVGQVSEAQPRDFFRSACFLAVERGNTESMKVFLDYGVYPSWKNFMGQPLLHRAVSRGNIDAVKQLLEKGADVDLQDENRRTAFTAHAQEKYLTVSKILENHGANINHTGDQEVHELYRAAAFGNSEMVLFFLQRGVSPDIANVYGWTPFHEAAANGHIECVQLLMKYKANASPVSSSGLTPLDLVHSGKVHYDWRTLGEDSEHYLNGKPYKEKPEEQDEWDRREDIRILIREYGAKTAGELSKDDKSAFWQVREGKYPCWDDEDSEVDEVIPGSV